MSKAAQLVASGWVSAVAVLGAPGAAAEEAPAPNPGRPQQAAPSKGGNDLKSIAAQALTSLLPGGSVTSACSELAKKMGLGQLPESLLASAVCPELESMALGTTPRPVPTRELPATEPKPAPPPTAEPPAPPPAPSPGPAAATATADDALMQVLLAPDPRAACAHLVQVDNVNAAPSPLTLLMCARIVALLGEASPASHVVDTGHTAHSAASSGADPAMQLRLGAQLLLAQEGNIDYVDARLALAPSYGVGAYIEWPLHRHFTLGAASALSWIADELDDELDLGRHTLFTLGGFAKLRHLIGFRDRGELYLVIPAGTSMMSWSADAGGTTSAGYNIGALAGAQVWFGGFSVFGQVGWVQHAVAGADWGQLNIQLGGAFTL